VRASSVHLEPKSGPDGLRGGRLPPFQRLLLIMTPFTTVLAGFLGLGGPEVIIILIILLVLFGGSKLPELAKGLGKSIKEFKNATREEPTPAPTPTPAVAPVSPAPAPANAETPVPRVG
jgi:sec-independent protein translocase protein TatA